LVLWDHAPRRVLAAWAAAVWAVAAGRFALAAAWRRAAPAPAEEERWGVRFTAGAAVNGALGRRTAPRRPAPPRAARVPRVRARRHGGRRGAQQRHAPGG